MMHEDLEIHITIAETDDVSRFKRYCSEKRFKTVILDLNGSFQCMSNQRYKSGNYLDIIEDSKKKLFELGFNVIRCKVEIKPKEVPDPDFLYYESHIRLILAVHVDLNQVRDFAKKHNIHVSVNLLKQTKTIKYQMLTLREYNLDLSNFVSKIEYIKDSLTFEGFIYDKVEIEECIYDSNVSLDNKWLKVN